MATRDLLGMELKAVTEIVDALDVTVHEPVDDETRQCVTHGMEFLEDHLRRLYRLEERGDLLDIVVGVHPELAPRLDRLRTEHDRIRQHAHGLVLTLENQRQPNADELHGIMRQLRHLIGEILRHELHERTVLIESTNLDRGGEG